MGAPGSQGGVHHNPGVVIGLRPHMGIWTHSGVNPKAAAPVSKVAANVLLFR